MKHCLKRLGAAAVLLACFANAPLPAATYTWDGSVNNWNSPHWTPGPVGFPGAGHLMVIDGGTVYVTDSATTYFPAGITLNGGALKVTTTGRLFSGADANTQVITVNTGAVLELDTWFKADSQSLGRLNQSASRIVLNGGTIRMTGVTGYGRGVTVNSGGATLETTADSDWLLNQLTDDVAWTYNGNPTLIFTGSGIGRFEKAITGGGAVIKRGSGKWTLSRTSSYTGDTTVEEGILVLRRGFLDDASTVSIARGAILSLRHYEGDVIGSLVLGGATMPPGTYSRSTHPAFIAGSGSLIIGGTNTSGTPALTWFYGSGGDAAIRAELTNSMNFCVNNYNAYAYLHGSIRADYNSGVPTAQAGFGGPITFGGSRNGRVAMHEMGHVFGVGTRGEWGANLSGGIWRGPQASRLIQQIDGPGAVINSDGTHFWPYGLNFDSEGGARNEICHVRMVEAFMQDMGLYQGISTISGMADLNIPINSSTGPISFTIGDPGVPASALVLHIASSNPSLVPTNRIVIGGSGANRTINLTPQPNLAGVSLVTLTVSGGRDAAIRTFALTVGNFTWNGGSGEWDTISSSWNNGTTTWPSIGGNNDAFFDGTPGIVSVQGIIHADDLAFSSSGYVITNGTLRFDHTPAITISGGMTATIGSSLDGPPGLAKEGAGTLVLTGDNPYTGGIFVNNGALIVHGTATSAATLEVRSGALLGGSGSLAPVTVRSGADLSPGPQPNTLLTTEGLNLEAGSVLTMDLNVISDSIVVNGDVTLNGTVNVRASGLVVNGTYTLIRFSGTRSGSGLTLGSVPSGYSMALDEGTPGQVRLLVAGGLDRSPILSAGAVWKFNATGADLGNAWRSNSFNDASWSSGPAQIGYGDNDEVTPINVSGGKPQIVYFRQAFTLTTENIGAMSNAVLSLLRDDGAVVYLNGVEVRRDNLPPAPAVIVHDTPALGAVGNADEETYFPSLIDPGRLAVGTNVLAVEVHQDDPASSDISFDLALDGVVQGNGAGGQFRPVSLVAPGAVWKYFAQPADLGAAWRSNSFNDTAWSSGPSMLGFGDANGLLPSTLVASNGQWTTYFRRAIHVPNPAQVATLSARILRDDGAVVYLNGAEIWRDENLPSTGAISYNTPAQAALGGADESTWIRFALDPAALVPGTNLIAIEVHQNAVNSSDLAMDFELVTTLLLPVDTDLTLAGDTLTWPLDAGWLSVYATTDLTPPVVWTQLTNAPVLLGDRWTMPLPPATNSQRFFRLQSP